MTEGWKTLRLGEGIQTNVRSVGREYPHRNILYLDTGSITRGKVATLQEMDLSEAPSRAKRITCDKDIVYSAVRPIQRHYGFIRNPPDNLVVSTGFVVISCKPDQISPEFLYQYLSSDESVEELDMIAEASTSTYPSLKPEDIENLTISLPCDQEEQKAIAAVLGSLDDKIDLLHRQNKTLEAMAETLFRQWFVEEAKSEWADRIMGDAVTIKGGTTPSTSKPEYWDGDIFWTSPRDLSNHKSVFMFDTTRKITAEGLAQIGSGLLPVGSVLLSSRAPIGYLAITDIPLAINQGYIGLVCDKGLSNFFVYLWCKANMEEIKGASNGSVFDEISKSVFKGLPCPVPDEETQNTFDAAVRPVFGKIMRNQKQIRTLEKLRDTLLPKLMSGEVRVAV